MINTLIRLNIMIQIDRLILYMGIDSAAASVTLPKLCGRIDFPGIACRPALADRHQRFAQ